MANLNAVFVKSSVSQRLFKLVLQTELDGSTRKNYIVNVLNPDKKMLYQPKIKWAIQIKQACYCTVKSLVYLTLLQSISRGAISDFACHEQSTLSGGKMVARKRFIVCFYRSCLFYVLVKDELVLKCIFFVVFTYAIFDLPELFSNGLEKQYCWEIKVIENKINLINTHLLHNKWVQDLKSQEPYSLQYQIKQ